MARDRSLPPAIAEYLQNWILDFRSPAFLFCDTKGGVVTHGGDLSLYGLNDLDEGDRAAEKAYFLEGLLPTGGEPFTLFRVETTTGVFADIHLFQAGENDCVLLLDASEDVTERTRIEQALRQTEERLRHSEKMEALGRLAGGVAHDFNNLLTVILGYSEMMVDAAPSAKFGEAARQITAAATRAAGMTQHMLSFSRRQVPRKQVLDLNQVVSGLEQMLRRLIGEDVVLNSILIPGLDRVEVDRGQMEQILVNLAANARDAMLKGGHLEIRTANVVVDDRYLRVHPSSQLCYGPHVSLSVTDDGCGMDAETKAHAFEPFFTSKSAGHGTGLGLSIVYGIVKQAGGEIELSSEIGKGTKVEVLLPVVRKTLEKEPANEVSLLPVGTETILLVEDEDGVRNLVRAVLTKLGYTILECSNPSDAVVLCDRYAGQIDLLLTDLIMPGMDGNELARRILVSRPKIRVLYMSGYALESFAKRGLQLPSSGFLAKPFTPGLLAEGVRKALALPNVSKLSSQQGA